MKRRALVAVAVVFAASASGQAHRLDEYLQASRLGIERDRVTVEIDLTPGVAVADRVLGWIDADGDGMISGREADAYAHEVLDAISLDVDGRRQPLVLVDRSFPAWSDVRQGIGTIRLRATARTPTASSGHHRLTYRNVHQTKESVYLVNALVPADPSLTITGQRRDVQQHELQLDYACLPPTTAAGLFERTVAPAFAASVLTVAIWRRRNHALRASI